MALRGSLHPQNGLDAFAGVACRLRFVDLLEGIEFDQLVKGEHAFFVVLQ